MSLHFAYGRTTLSSSDWSITVNTGGGNLTGATKYFSLQAQNPIGKNLQLISSPITFQTGDSITFTINESALTEAEGWTHYVIGVSNSATPSTFNQIARINIYDLSTGSIDFDTQEVFPLTLTIDENSQLTTATYVEDKESLPTTNLIYGMRRGVTENNYIYEYNPFAVISPNDDDILSADVGVWLKKEEFTTYVEDIAQYGGCAYDLYNLNDFSQVELPAYNADGTNSLRVKYYLINNSSFTLQPGTGITLSAQIGGVERTEIFDGKIYYRINGVVTPTDGTLRTTSTITGQPLDFIDTDYVYTKATPVTISKDYINNQTGLYIDVYVNFLNLEFNNLLPDGYLQIFLSYISPKGVFTPVGTLFEKGIIYNKYNKRRVLPDIGLNVVVGEGEGLVKNFAWYSCNTTVSGLTANTANQKLYVNINGVVFPDVAERTSSVLRAIVDTTPKESKISTWTSYSAVTSDSALTVEVDYECDSDLNQQIRDTYPDVIAGDWGIFNPTRLNIYVQRQSDSEIRKFTGFIPAGNNVSQEFIITDWSSGTVVGSVPSSSASFFDPTTNIFSTTASAGNFSSGNYRVAHTYVWNGDTVSDVSHSVAVGCISESQVNGEQVFGTTTYNTIAQIKAEENLYDGLQLYCKNTQQLYVYDENSTLDDDDNFVLLPDSGVGRWVSVVINKRSTFIKTVAPTITDDENDGYVVGDKWLDTVAGEEYTLLDASVGAADWQQVGGGDISYNDLTDLPTLGTAAALDVNEPNGVCGLDGSGKVSATYLPSYVDDVLEYANLAGFPVTGETAKIYIALDTNRTYRWSGSLYVEVSNPFSGSYNDLTDLPNLAAVATTGSYNDLSDKPTVSGGGGLTSVYTTDVTLAASAGNFYLLNGTITVNLPAGVNGDRIGFADYLPNFYASPVTLNPNGAETIAGLASLTLDNDRDCIELLFQTDRWVVTSLESFADSVATANIVSRGVWDNATNYAVNDIVNYSVDGNTYIANTANINKTPGTDPEWDLFARKGDSGGLTLTTTKTTNYTANNGDEIPCDTIAISSFTVTTPTSGEFAVFDVVGNTPTTGFGINNLTITPTSGTIMGTTSYVLDVGAVRRRFILVGTDWRVA